ncbi:MAG: hypothetical protein GY713_13980, partial [Actinomycetia bacterium]|nr:hypothetical protein [Actinomycetes bacterium]
TIRPITLFTRAVALTHLGRADEARPIFEDLLRRGWQHPDFLRLSRELGYGPDLPDE